MQRFPVLFLSLFTSSSFAFAAQLPPRVQPTGLATLNTPMWPACVSRTFTGFPVSETAQGVDLNGDGDTTDWVFHLHDLRSGITRSLGHAVRPSAVSAATDRFAAFAVDEFADGLQDHNGDGDHGDYVLFLFDRAIGQVRNVGIAMNPATGPVLTDSVLAFTASEGAQAFTDLDGNGVISDCVYTLDPVTGVGIASASPPAVYSATPYVISGTRVYWSALADGRVWVTDRATQTTTALGWKSNGRLTTSGGLVAFGIAESTNGAQDLNGDGDATDVVVGVVGSAGGPVSLLPLEGFTNTYAPRFVVGTHLLLGLRSEGGAFGADLNGDSDTLDHILTLYDDRTGALTNLARASRPNAWLIADIDGDTFAYAISEQDEGVDLNFDGDANDSILEMRDITGAQFDRIALSVDTATSQAIQISRGQLGFLVSELGQGQDLDGDGQLLSKVPHVFDPALWFQPPVNLGLGTREWFTPSFHFHHGRASFLVSETTSDLNGDGDLTDDVLVVRGATAGSALNTLAVGTGPTGGVNGLMSRNGVVIVAASEAQSGNVSLNGDLDAADKVAFVIRMNP